MLPDSLGTAALQVGSSNESFDQGPENDVARQSRDRSPPGR